MGSLRREGSKVSREASASPLMETLMRLGYVVRGLVYGAIGVLAFQVVINKGGTLTDTQGAIAALGKTSLGSILLYVILLGLIGYALWGVIRAAFNSLHKGSDLKGIAECIGFGVSGISYALLAVATYGLITGAASAARSGAQAAQTQQATASILSNSWGPAVVGIAAVIVTGVGLLQIVQGLRPQFKQQFKPYALSSTQRLWIERLGRFGTAARGVVFALVGFLLFLADYRHDPSQAQGIDGRSLPCYFGTLAISVQTQSPLLQTDTQIVNDLHHLAADHRLNRRDYRETMAALSGFRFSDLYDRRGYHLSHPGAGRENRRLFYVRRDHYSRAPDLPYGLVRCADVLAELDRIRARGVDHLGRGDCVPLCQRSEMGDGRVHRKLDRQFTPGTRHQVGGGSSATDREPGQRHYAVEELFVSERACRVLYDVHGLYAISGLHLTQAFLGTQLADGHSRWNGGAHRNIAHLRRAALGQRRDGCVPARKRLAEPVDSGLPLGQAALFREPARREGNPSLRQPKYNCKTYAECEPRMDKVW